MKNTAVRLAGAALLVSVLIAVPGCNQDIPEPPTPSGNNTTSESLTPEATERPTATTNATAETPENAAKPDLIIESVSYVPVYTAGLNFAELETLYFTVTVKNIGDAAARGAFYVSNTRDDYDYYTYGERVNNPATIKPGQTLSVSITKGIPAELVSDDVWTIWFIVNHQQDHKNVSKLRRGIEESNYDNNTFDLSLTIDDLRDARGIAAQAGKPDLIIDSISYRFDMGIIFDLRVKNTGTAPAGGPFYVVNNSQYVEMYSPHREVNRLGHIIAPGETLEVPFARIIPTLESGYDIWWLKFTINHRYDPNDKSALIPGIEESDYGNNAYELTLNVSTIIEEARIDYEKRHPPPRMPCWGPQILNPQGGATTSLLPVFAWAPVPGATKYMFVLAEDAALTQIVLVAYPTLTTVSIANYLKPGTTYFWAVRTIQPTEGCMTISTFRTQADP